MWDNLYKTLRPLFQAPDQILKHVDNQTTLLDVGCGYGDLCAQIIEQKSPQSVLGIDHDDHKIQTAQTRYAHLQNVSFEVADLLRLREIEAQTILIIDVLHYFPTLDQIALLQKLATSTTVKKIIVRDAIRSSHPGYALTRIHEFIMTRLNKTKVKKTKFTFLTKEEWRRMALTLHMKITIEKASLPFYYDHLIIFTQ
ncbi:MAG: class I SAM-dependent methyltransferase [Candidatus Latescibacteria bacterium]|nr:class I SAM-dependent methyltransferase [Candidatus Latescibacterota bacterium]